MEIIIAAGLCLLLIALIMAMIWMTVIRMRGRKDASEVIQLEVAICIHKNNGDLIIRQRRGKSIMGLVLGLILMSAGPAILIASLVQDFTIDIEGLCIDTSLLAFGVVVAGVSLRGFREPHLIISAARREIEIRYGGIRRKQTWSFDALANVTYQRRTGEEALLIVAEFDPTYRLVIGLQHTDGRTVRIGTAVGKAAQRVLELLAAVTGKPVSSL